MFDEFAEAVLKKTADDFAERMRMIGRTPFPACRPSRSAATTSSTPRDEHAGNGGEGHAHLQMVIKDMRDAARPPTK